MIMMEVDKWVVTLASSVMLASALALRLERVRERSRSICKALSAASRSYMFRLKII